MKKLGSKGYTLIELLTVVSILVIISGIITGILYSTLRGSSKTRITTEVTQNGNYALSIISGAIIDSGSVTQVNGIDIADCTASPSGTSITLKRLGGSTTTFSCSGGIIASNSASLIDQSSVEIAENSCSFYCNQLSNDPYSVPIIGVTFGLKESNSGLFESQASATFNTATSMRNYSP